MDKFQKKIMTIISDVKIFGDKAIYKYSKKFDKVGIKSQKLLVKNKEVKKAINVNLAKSIIEAAKNIKLFHKKEFNSCCRKWSFAKGGAKLNQIFRPVEKVGIYVPGGKYAYFSTILMTAIPARIAGVKEIIVVTPPNNISAELLFAAKISKVDKIYRIGGPMAISALAYGTETIPKVDLIVGPGNKYVTEAKRQVFGDVGIDMLAGPSEVVILCDKSAKADYIFYDLMAQAEHDKNSKAYLFSNDKNLINKTRKLVPKKFKNQIIISHKSLKESIKIINDIAPEHLEIIHNDTNGILDKIKNAGTIFIGNYSPVVLGDYFAGPSHVLPTNKTAKFSSGLSVKTFLKHINVIQYSKKELMKNVDFISEMANTEGLEFHSKSIKIRKNNREIIKNNQKIL